MTQMFCSPREAPKIIGISRPVIYRMIARGELRAVKIGARTLLDLEHAVNFIRSRPQLGPQAKAVWL